MSELRNLPVRVRDADEPRDPTELILQEIWLRELPVDSLGVDDDFFELGGTSLGAVRVIAEVSKQWGVRLPLKVMAGGCTIAELALRLRTGAETATAPSSLVPLRPGGGTPTVVFVHPLGGGVLWYRFLANLLPEGVRCLGAQALGLEPEAEPHRDIPAMAAHYLKESSSVCDPAELLLVGYSFGGLVAYEMACQAERAGRPPRGVAVLDATVGESPGESAGRARLLWSLVGHALGLDLDVAELAALPPGQLTARLLEAGIAQGALPQDLGSDRLARLVETYPINAEAERTYRLPAYGGQIELIRAAGGRVGPASEAHWRERCPGMRLHEVTGDHLNLLSRENAPVVMGVLRDSWFNDGYGDADAH